MQAVAPEKHSNALLNRFNPLGENPAITVLISMVLASAILVWANFSQPFYGFDDSSHLQYATENSFSEIFSISGKEYLMPISFLTLRLERNLFGPPFSENFFVKEEIGARPANEDFPERTVRWATATRIINALYHALAGWLLWLFFRQIGTPPAAAWVAAFAWTVHPMACESVCWISERKNVLTALFGFGSLYAWAALCKSAWRWPVTSVLYILAALSKPTAVGFLPLYSVLEIINPGGTELPFRSGKKWALLLAGLTVPVATTLALSVTNLKICSSYFVEYIGGSMWTAILTDIEIFARYMGNVLFPSDLSYFYGIKPILGLGDSRVWYYGAAIACGCALSVFAPADNSSRKRSLLGLVWFFVALGPASNLVPIPYWMQDRYAYFSAAGLLLTAVEIARGLAIRFNGVRFAPVCGWGFVAFLTIMSLVRSVVFENSEKLFADAATRQPLSGMAQAGMYNQHLLKARTARDMEVRREECRLLLFYLQRASQCPDLANFRDRFEMHLNAAHMLLSTGDFEGTLKLLNEWVSRTQLKPNPPTEVYKLSTPAMKRMYNPESMAFAHILVAEALLMSAGTPPAGLSNASAASRAERIKNCDSALNLLDPSSDIMGPHVPSAKIDWNRRQTLLMAQILNMRSRLRAENNDPDGAAKDSKAANELLNSQKNESVDAKAKFGVNSAKPSVLK